MKQIFSILKTFFGYDTFRPLQEEIIQTIINKQSCLVLMPTGGGKSICYQVPAIAMEGTALVISPLIALMKDQVESLRNNGVKAAFLNSSLSREEETAIETDCLSGKLKLLYVSPEKAVTMGQAFFETMKLSLIAIDEAHCISQWGHDFRPEYTKLRVIREMFPHIPVVALTATADKTTRKDILNQLNIENSQIFISSFDRPNIRLDVKSGLKKKMKLAEITNFINKRKGESGIVYCLSRKNTEMVSDYLNLCGIKCAFYHAGMSTEDRTRVQEEFIRDDVKIICATIAFGMGIDKSNIRWVIHYNLPAKIEGYYQEIGRAGRDGLKSDALLFYNISDLMMLTRFAEESGQPQLNKEKLLRMQQFAEARVCRRRILLNYFGEIFTQNCNNCDVCSFPPPVSDGTVAAQKAMSALIRTEEKVGINMLIHILRGSQNSDLLEKGYQNIKTYGTGKEHSYETWQAYLLQFLQLGLIEIAYDESFTLKVTSHGHNVLKGLEKVMIAEIRRTSHPAFEDEFELDAVIQDDSLFEKLRFLRKMIAESEGIPPYIVFTDKTLYEMSINVPVTRDAMLAIQGVSENKLNKYGVDFLAVILEQATDEQKKASFNVLDHITSEKLKSYIQIMESRMMQISAAALSKILVGSEHLLLNPAAQELPFFGLLKNKIKYTPLAGHIKKYFDEQQEIKQKHAADYYFGAEMFNNIPETTWPGIKQSIASLPLNRPNSTIDNPHILNARKAFPRSYEHWYEPEISIFKEVASQTNNLQLIADIFQRSPDSLKAYYKKTFMAPVVPNVVE